VSNAILTAHTALRPADRPAICIFTSYWSVQNHGTWMAGGLRPQQRLLEPDQRIDAELHVIDPGKAAIGFEIDACLRAESGNIGCANEARRRAPG